MHISPKTACATLQYCSNLYLRIAEPFCFFAYWTLFFPEVVPHCVAFSRIRTVLATRERTDQLTDEHTHRHLAFHIILASLRSASPAGRQLHNGLILTNFMGNDAQTVFANMYNKLHPSDSGKEAHKNKQ